MATSSQVRGRPEIGFAQVVAAKRSQISTAAKNGKEKFVSTPMAVFKGVDFARSRLFCTDDLDEARSVCSRIFSPHELTVVGHRQRLQASMDHLPIGAFSLNRLRWGASVAVDPDRLRDYYLVSMPVQGTARFNLAGHLVEVSAGCAGIVNASQRFRFDASPDFDQIALWLDRRSVEAGWQALTGYEPRRSIDFHCAMTIDGPAWRALEPMMQLLARRLRAGAEGAGRFAHFDARLEEMLVTTLLLNAPHNLVDSLLPPPRGAASRHLNKAKDYMLERLESPVTLNEVAASCGVSTRTIQAVFHAEHGKGPIQWLREQRLLSVRETLLSGEDGQRVAQVAMRFGFTHLGEFSQAYHRSFGETASQTLQRRR